MQIKKRNEDPHGANYSKRSRSNSRFRVGFSIDRREIPRAGPSIRRGWSKAGKQREKERVSSNGRLVAALAALMGGVH